MRPSIIWQSKPRQIEVPSALLSLDNFTVCHIIKLVQTSERSLSPADSIPVPLLCLIIDCICSSITKAIHSFLLSEVVTSAFKAAIVKPILVKAGSDPVILSNYWPLSLLHSYRKY